MEEVKFFQKIKESPNRRFFGIVGDMKKQDVFKQKEIERNNGRFRIFASIYDVIEILFAHIRRIIVEQQKLSRATRVLDVACGTGSQAIAFAKKGFSVVGIDLSPHMLAYARKKVREGWDATFLCGDAVHIPFEISTFDLSSIFFGLHEMSEETALLVLREMKRTTKNGGRIIIADYRRPQNRFFAFLVCNVSKIWESEHYAHFIKIGLQSYLNTVGLQVETKALHLFGNLQVVTCINRK